MPNEDGFLSYWDGLSVTWRMTSDCLKSSLCSLLEPPDCPPPSWPHIPSRYNDRLEHGDLIRGRWDWRLMLSQELTTLNMSPRPRNHHGWINNLMMADKWQYFSVKSVKSYLWRGQKSKVLKFPQFLLILCILKVLKYNVLQNEKSLLPRGNLGWNSSKCKL